MLSEDNVMADDLAGILDGFRDRRVLLIGDSILDIYTYGVALGLSAETPTIVAREREVKRTLGGAALVCRNLLELGAHATFITLVGQDENAAHVRAFSSPRLEFLPIIDAGRPTTVKHRFWVDNYKLFQLDNRDDSYVGPDTVASVLGLVQDRLSDVDAVIVSDYRHGLLSPELISSFMGAARSVNAALYVDSQVAQNAGNHTLYRGGATMCLNLKEARTIDADFAPRLDAGAFDNLRRELDTDRIVIKLGEEGAMMLTGGRVVASPAAQVKPVDTTGAGDAFLSALCLCVGQSPAVALRVANAWAGLSVGIHGTSPPCRDDLPRALGLA
jgi:D-beta-D-heptose 7-phosphate kinase/D-beta-D-heptose 1-phosphate adenosyltransferase